MLQQMDLPGFMHFVILVAPWRHDLLGMSKKTAMGNRVLDENRRGNDLHRRLRGRVC
jgi:hypothetical protein